MAAESRERVKSGQFLAHTSLRSGMTGKLGDLPAQLAVSLPGSIPGSCQYFLSHCQNLHSTIDVSPEDNPYQARGVSGLNPVMQTGLMEDEWTGYVQMYNTQNTETRITC